MFENGYGSLITGVVLVAGGVIVGRMSSHAGREESQLDICHSISRLQGIRHSLLQSIEDCDPLSKREITVLKTQLDSVESDLEFLMKRNIPKMASKIQKGIEKAGKIVLKPVDSAIHKVTNLFKKSKAKSEVTEESTPEAPEIAAA